MNTMNKKIFACITLGLAVSALSGFAEEAAEPSTYDQIWDRAILVKNSDGPIQKLAFTGRLQGDAYSFKSEDTSNDDTDWRRLRLGLKATVFDDFVIHSEMDLDMNEADSDSWDKFYKRLTDSYVGWKGSKALNVKVGKQSAGFTLDGATSSKKLIVPERSIVARNIWFGTEYFTGATAYGNLEEWNYKVGGFSSSGEDEFGHFDSGFFTLLSAGHSIGEEGSLRLDYVYNNPDYDTDYSVGTRDLEHIISLVYKDMLTEKLGLWTGVNWAKGISDKSEGINHSDLFGVEIMPFYNLSDELQLVFQYAGVTSTDSKSEIVMARYAERNNDKEKVETAHNFLLGFNWYLYGHKLKWQNAIEYNYGDKLAGSGDDYNGYGLTSAIRISW
jgi:phosphate-selective porin OprO/OprP